MQDMFRDKDIALTWNPIRNFSSDNSRPATRQIIVMQYLYSSPKRAGGWGPC